MKVVRTICMLLFTCGWAASPSSAVGQEFEASYNARFLKSHPLLGTEVSDTELYAADGSPFKLSSARGKYTVVVFGCLT